MNSKTSDESRSVTIVARGQIRVPLGKFTSDYKLKGFSVLAKPESLPKEDLETQVVRIDDSNDYRMYMNVVNYSDRKVQVTIEEIL